MAYQALIVEDELIITMAYDNMLRDAKFKKSKNATSGKQALKTFDELTQVDLVILDFKLKGDMNGIEVATEIRKKSDVPILFTSGNSYSEISLLKEQIPNSDFLIKPVNTNSLLKSVKALLKG